MKKEKLTIKSSTQPSSSSQVQPENISQQTFPPSTLLQTWKKSTKNSTNSSKITESKSSIPLISRNPTRLTTNC